MPCCGTRPGLKEKRIVFDERDGIDAGRKRTHRSTRLRAGWRTRTELRTGEPLRGVLDAVSTADAQLVVVGARGASGARRLLLGSVADGVLNRSPVPVLLAR